MSKLLTFYSLVYSAFVHSIDNRQETRGTQKRLLIQGHQTASQVTAEQIQLLSSEVNSLRNSLHIYKTHIHDLQLKQNASDIKVQKLESDLQKALSSAGGSTYVRWGRTTCPGNGTELVYAGYVGGSYFDHTGAATEFVCLPKDPQWGEADLSTESQGKMYGGEYEFSSQSRLTKYFGQNLRDHNAPCAVCSTSRPHMLMIPARISCYGGWTLEYKGYLTSGSWVQKAASQYVCLDGVPELLPAGQNDENGKLFYLVEGVCGSLECPPYVNGKELACVVCTK